MISNARGAAILAGTVDKTNFSGPPIILHGEGMTSTTNNALWTALSAFADTFSAPLIGVDTGGGHHEDAAPLVAALQLPHFARCFTPAQQSVPVHVGPAPDFATTVAAFCGPIFSISTYAGLTDATNLIWKGAWVLSSLLSRAPNGHRYGWGMHAIGNNVPGARQTSPVYALLSSTMTDTLARITLLWQRGENPTRTALNALLATDADRPGAQRWTSASLQPFVLTSDPLP
jgi:hypothetical protein